MESPLKLPQAFYECYSERDDSAFKNMMQIISQRSSRVFCPPFFEKHHIVPKGWFKLRVRDVDQSQENVVYLSPVDYMRVNVLLYHYFYHRKDLQMLKFIAQHLRYMSNDAYQCVVQNGDVPGAIYMKYDAVRQKYHRKLG